MPFAIERVRHARPVRMKDYNEFRKKRIGLVLRVRCSIQVTFIVATHNLAGCKIIHWNQKHGAIVEERFLDSEDFARNDGIGRRAGCFLVVDSYYHL